MALQEWLARRAGAELDWAALLLLGRAPLAQRKVDLLTQAGKAAGRTDQHALAARATRVAVAWPGVAWAGALDADVRERLADVPWIAADLRRSHGAATTWRPPEEDADDAEAG